ncbi:ubiquinol-cytochrome c reductase cytochrome b subunit [Bartonella sp. JB63]|nr:ubiquinol-cytochrome c reductase cytochrome b subunit [Bartonella sp. JB15]AQX28873.1 ubiquinol-cytochrome c reductase cytochrome b subunit [Bartonella sp. JB63]
MRKFFPYLPKRDLARWLDKHLPLLRFLYNTFIAFPVSRNLSYFYTFGGILTIMLLS